MLVPPEINAVIVSYPTLEEHLPLRTTSHADEEPHGSIWVRLLPWAVYIYGMCENIPGPQSPQQVLRESGEGGQTAEEVEGSATATLTLARPCQ